MWDDTFVLLVVCDCVLFVFVAADCHDVCVMPLFGCVGIAALLAACCASCVCCSSLVTVADDLTVLFFCVLVVLLCCVLWVGVDGWMGGCLLLNHVGRYFCAVCSL